jgi:hypothetical protein
MTLFPTILLNSFLAAGALRLPYNTDLWTGVYGDTYLRYESETFAVDRPNGTRLGSDDLLISITTESIRFTENTELVFQLLPKGDNTADDDTVFSDRVDPSSNSSTSTSGGGNVSYRECPSIEPCEYDTVCNSRSSYCCCGVCKPEISCTCGSAGTYETCEVHVLGEECNQCQDNTTTGDDFFTPTFGDNISSTGHGWRLGRAYIRDEPNFPLALWSNDNSMIGVSRDDQLFHCEIMEFDLVNTELLSDVSASVKIKNVFISAFSRTYDMCQLDVVNPCPADKICHAKNGQVNCVDPEDGMFSPVLGVNRQDFFDTYLCVQYPDQEETSTELYWEGQSAFLQASHVNASLVDGIMFRFEDDLVRPQLINSGSGGEKISREDNWTEDGVACRASFYFEHSGSGWVMNETRISNSLEDWIYSGITMSMIEAPSITDLFFCHVMEFTYYDRKTASPGSPGLYGGMFVARNVYIGAFLPADSYDVCSMEIYNPCQNNPEGKFYCRAVDGQISCLDDEPENLGSQLLCENPANESAEVDTQIPNATLNWGAEKSYLYARNVTTTFSESWRPPLSFEDQLGRPVFVSDGGGSQVAREDYWYEQNTERRLSFATSFSSSNTSWALDDVRLWSYVENYPDWLYGSTGILLSADKGSLYHCDHVEVNFVSEASSVLGDAASVPVRARFTADDFVLGIYLEEGYDVCALKVFNPCRQFGMDGQLCHSVDGSVSCVDSNDEDISAALGRKTERSQIGIAACPDNPLSVAMSSPTPGGSSTTAAPLPTGTSCAVRACTFVITLCLTLTTAWLI